MTSLRTPAGQASLEALVALSAVLGVTLVAVALLLQCLGTIILNRWAAYQSQCVAVKDNPLFCAAQTKNELAHSFALRNVTVKTQIIKGVIHSDVSGNFAGLKEMRATYDLGASEYKRVQKPMSWNWRKIFQ